MEREEKAMNKLTQEEKYLLLQCKRYGIKNSNDLDELVESRNVYRDTLIMLGDIINLARKDRDDENGVANSYKVGRENE